MHPFISDEAVLEYKDINKLTSTRSCEGCIGINDFILETSNGPRIKSEVNAPSVQPASTVSGTSSWEEY